MNDNIKLTKLPEPDICHYVVTVWRDGVECEIDKGPRYTVEQMQAYAREAARLNAQAVPECKVVDVGFRWDGGRQEHVPQITVEFEPVKANSPNNAKGWTDRDVLVTMLSAALAVQPAHSMPDGVIERAIEALTYCEALNWEIEQQKLRALSELRAMLSAAPAAPQPAQQPLTVPDGIPLNIIRKWPDGFDNRLQHVWLDVVSFIPSVKLYDLQRVLAEFGLRMEVYEDAPAPQPAQPLDLGVMELAESVGLIGPASRTDDLHEAIQRFHDLIVVNASIKAARHFADGLAQQPLTDAQIDEIWQSRLIWSQRDFARAIEQARRVGVKP